MAVLHSIQECAIAGIHQRGLGSWRRRHRQCGLGGWPKPRSRANFFQDNEGTGMRRRFLATVLLSMAAAMALTGTLARAQVQAEPPQPQAREATLEPQIPALPPGPEAEPAAS